MKKTLYEGKFLRLCEKDGWEFVERANCYGVIAIIGITDENKLIFVEQFRVPAGAHVIEFPAGLVGDVDGDESWETAAIREMFEETGYEVGSLEFMAEGPLSSGMSPNKIRLFRAKDLVKKGPGGGDETENITVHEIPVADVDEWLEKQKERGALVDPKVYAGLYFLNKP